MKRCSLRPPPGSSRIFFQPPPSINPFGSYHSSYASSYSRSQSENEVKEKFIATWRRAIIEDKYSIKELKKNAGDISKFLFKDENIEELIQNSYFSLVQLNNIGKVVAFTAYNTTPNFSWVSLLWTDWLETHYRIKGINSRNVLFIHYMVWDPQKENEFLGHLLEISFAEFIHLKQIIIVKPPEVQIPNFFKQYFVPVSPFGLEEYENDSVQSLLICLRAKVLYPLKVRTAFEDDIEKAKLYLGKLGRQMTKEQKEYMAEMEDIPQFLERKDKKTFICEKNDDFVAVMVINFMVDLEVLNKEFELVPFNGLRKKSAQQEFDDEIISNSESTCKCKDRYSDVTPNEFLFDQINWDVLVTDSSKKDSVDDSFSSSSSFLLETDLLPLSTINSASNVEIHESLLTLSTLSSNTSQTSIKSDEKVPFETRLCHATHYLSPVFEGELNCFAIDFLVADTQKVDEKLVLLDLLKLAFQVIGDKDYCLLIIPSEYFPDRMQEFFVRVTPKLVSRINLELYLCHKQTLIDPNIFVKIADEEDLHGLDNFLKNIDYGEAIYKDIRKACFVEGDDFRSYILLDEKEVIGVSVLEFSTFAHCRDYQQDFYTFFNVAREIPEFRDSQRQLLLKHLVVNPTYHCHTKFFMREIMWHSNVTCLFYAYNFPDKDHCSVVTVLEEFSAIKSRKKALSDKRYLLEDDFNLPFFPFSLYFFQNKSCSFSKIHINIIIVVVGASRTALSFLENLIFGPSSAHVQYNNLICVTPHALESHQTQGSDILDLMFPIKDECTRNYAFILSLKTYVTFVYGSMTSINRSEKYITVNNKIVIKYDYLILTCGAQYLSPVPPAKVKQYPQKNYFTPLERFLVKEEDNKRTYQKNLSNMFLINTTWDTKHAFWTLKELTNDPIRIKKIIVYGHNIRALLTIHTLIKLGIPGDVIAFVEPFSQENGEVTIFNDFSVDQAVLQSLKKNKVTFYSKYFLYDWITEEDRITSVIFHSKNTQLEIPCLAFFPFTKKLVCDITRKACFDSGLVFDGRLVINHNFKTNDDYIYAAGPLTKYARRYYSSDKDHMFYNSREVGFKLSQIIRSKIDPFSQRVLKEDSAKLAVPQLKRAVQFHCQLPGDFNFFVMRKPGKEVDLETAYNLQEYGEVLYTGDCQMRYGYGYFRLHLNVEGFVESITCYTKDKIDYINLSKLYGLHEKLLNNLLCRYDLSLITDFFEYFRQPWTHVLFHEDFKYLRAYNKLALSRTLIDGKSFIDKAWEIVQIHDSQTLPLDAIQLLEKEFENSSVKFEIEKNILDFIEYFKNDLPGYATRQRLD